MPACLRRRSRFRSPRRSRPRGPDRPPLAGNGGPLLAAAIPVAPVVAGDALAGRYVLGLDAVTALTAGVASAALALYVADVRATGSLRPWNRRPAPLLAVSRLAAIGVAAAVSFLTTAPPRARSWYLPFAPLWLLTLAAGGGYWNVRLRELYGGRRRAKR